MTYPVIYELYQAMFPTIIIDITGCPGWAALYTKGLISNKVSFFKSSC